MEKRARYIVPTRLLLLYRSHIENLPIVLIAFLISVSILRSLSSVCNINPILFIKFIESHQTHRRFTLVSFKDV